MLKHNLINEAMDQCLRVAYECVGRTGWLPAYGAATIGDNRDLVIVRPNCSASGFLSLLNVTTGNPASIFSPVEPSLREAQELLGNEASDGVYRAIFGSPHPAQSQSGKAAHLLKRRGVEVYTLDYSSMTSEADRRWWVWARDERPYIHLKISLSKDGAVVINRKRPTRMASPDSHLLVHRLRGQHDALLVGARTIREDDPQMTYRGEEGYPAPQKIIFSQTQQFNPTLKVFQGAQPLILNPDCVMPGLKQMAQSGITSILVEGGLSTYRFFLDRSLWDELSLVWTQVASAENSEYLDRRLPIGEISAVGPDTWETVKVRIENQVR